MVISGEVVHGEKRGRAMGFPTANIAPALGSALPPEGVYCCLVRLPQRPAMFGATVSVGSNPTFADITSVRVEVHIHDFDEQLYGLRLELQLVQRLRDMHRFAGPAELIAQMQRDVIRSRALLAGLA